MGMPPIDFLLAAGGAGEAYPISIGVASILVLGVGAQWLGWRLKLPSILLLLFFGFAAGPFMLWATDGKFGLDVNRLVDDDLLLSLISLSVGIILFEGGLTLIFREIKTVKRAVVSLVTVGAIVTWTISAFAAWLLLGLSLEISILLGAVLIVTGPTVIGPLLRFVRPTGSVGKVLKWEGIVIDPIGAMTAVLVFEAILVGFSAQDVAGAASTIGVFTLGVIRTTALGTLVGASSAWLLVILIRRFLIPDHLQVPVTLMLVAAAFVISNYFIPESGLFSTTVMGIVLGNQTKVHIRHILEFKETLVVLLIAALFIVLSARLDLATLGQLSWTAPVFILVLLFVARPAAVFLSTIGSALTFKDKLFLCWMAPRGIVAAAVSSVFGLRLARDGVPDADQLVPYTFLVIVSTVAIYGLSAAFVAKRLGLAKPGSAGFLLIGSHAFGRRLGQLLKEQGLEVLMVDTNYLNAQQARMTGLNATVANALSPSVMEDIELTSIGRLMALTANQEVNSLACVHYAKHFGRSNVFQLCSRAKKAPGKQGEVDSDVEGRQLFAEGITYESLMDRLEGGAELKATPLTKEYTFKQYEAAYGNLALPLLLVGEGGTVEVFTPDKPPTPRAGMKVVSMVTPAHVEAEIDDEINAALAG